MKTSLFIISFFILTQLNAQTVDKNYVVNWIKAIDTTIQVDSAVAYKIDRQSCYSYDTFKLNARLRQININRLKSIFIQNTRPTIMFLVRGLFMF